MVKIVLIGCKQPLETVQAPNKDKYIWSISCSMYNQYSTQELHIDDAPFAATTKLPRRKINLSTSAFFLAWNRPYILCLAAEPSKQ